MLSRLDLPAGEEGWTSPRGELRIKHPAPGVVVFKETGFLIAEFAPHIMRHSNQAKHQGEKAHLFVDAYDLEGYDPEIRNGGTAWLRENAEKVAAQHMLVRSRLTKMGLTVVSLAVGGLIKGHHERQSFERDLAEAVVRSRSTPPKA